jgi:hypothetical protein
MRVIPSILFSPVLIAGLIYCHDIDNFGFFLLGTANEVVKELIARLEKERLKYVPSCLCIGGDWVSWWLTEDKGTYG